MRILFKLVLFPISLLLSVSTAFLTFLLSIRNGYLVFIDDSLHFCSNRFFSILSGRKSCIGGINCWLYPQSLWITYDRCNNDCFPGSAKSENTIFLRKEK